MPHASRKPASTRSRRSRRRPVTALMVVLPLLALVWAIVVGVPGVTPGETSVPFPVGSTAAAPVTGDAADLLATLPVKGKAAKTGYDRTGEFGSAWRDVDDNGCDTRNDILARDLAAIVTDASCRVLSGQLLAPYTGESVSFERGETTSMLVQIDHLVALSNAWQTGAAQLTREERIALANDPLNLLASDGVSNSQKGDGDAATWLPAEKSFRCEYVAHQISVKATYGLWVAPAEHDAMVRVLATCPGQPAYSATPGLD
ncbi:HNH endonuclease family protein [Cryobacterium sp. TMT2-14]|uniref:HNH endonuclease family protein n=1 Tax=Cryobacterium sp. TMT2-14 TaxID=1259245 RepID=UPI00106D57A0|nr:HNH endonuclease family protein [Cryobacterium sp. TMT2-14]TFC36866.1 HNH endonuclease [Cryobacterium sp. TMT2-14]